MRLAFGTLTAGLTAGTPAQSTVSITDDDDPGVRASLSGRPATASTEGASVTVTVQLSADPERSVTVPITATGQGGAVARGLSRGCPTGVTFNAGDTSKTFIVGGDPR